MPMDLLTTGEAADYLRLGERKLYELVAAGTIPCSKVTGKWLFPRHELDRWVISGLARPAGMMPAEAPPIVGGSQDDLLEWSLRQSGSGLASLTEGTKAGVGRLLRGEIAAAAIHFHGEADEDNVAFVERMSHLHDALLVGLARREQGLLLPPGNPKGLGSLEDVIASQSRLAVRQQGAGAQMLLDGLLSRLGVTLADLNRLQPACLSGPDLAAAIRDGRADCGIATRSAANSAGLDFVPLTWESFDLVMRQRTYFTPPLQALVAFLAGEAIRRRATDLSGYDLTPAGTIRYFA